MSARPARLLRLFLLGGALFGCSGTRPRNLGLTAGLLRPCPASPNCVSSEIGTAEVKRVAPFSAPAGLADFARLTEIVSAWPRTRVITTGDGYLHAESTTRLMRFVDDVELRFDSTARVIHVRSASRLGRRDFGVNRERIDGLRAKYDAR